MSKKAPSPRPASHAAKPPAAAPPTPAKAGKPPRAAPTDMAAEMDVPALPTEGLVPALPQAEEFAGKVALITGGTDGLGKHLGRTLTSLGTFVFFCGRRAEVGKALEREWGPRAHFVQCDLSSATDPAVFVKRAGEFRGHLDYVVNNAALDRRTPVRTATAAEFDQLVAVNLRAYFLVCQAALPYLEKGMGKSIVNVGTTNCMHGWAGMSVYSASKAGIVGLTRTLARDLGESGIRINTMSPGWIMTERQLTDLVSAREKRELVETQCVKYLLTEQFCTPVTLFLLSRASLAISGQNLVVDGGKLFR
jgi:NAD(P)-dependent dehydrogenase (short-subunit alcohol dehydrogenase family)